MEPKKQIFAINYSDVLELGFKRKELKDTIFFDMYGFEYFAMTLKLTKHLYLDWDCRTRKVLLIRNKGYDLLSKIEVRDFQSLNSLIKFFKENSYEDVSVLEINSEKYF